MKKILVSCLVLFLLFTPKAFAAESEVVGSDELNRIITETTVVEPRYTYLGYMTVGLDIYEDGRIVYGGSARAPYHNVRITLYLQRSTNGLFWEELEGTVKTAYDSVSADGGRTVDADDYFYRVKIITDVMDADRNIIETATGYSDSERY